MFEALIRDAAKRFGLGDKANGLLAALLSTIFDERSGGIAGLFAKFREQGLGDLFGSWIGNAQPKPIEPQQLENVLGANVISGIADKLGMARGTAIAAVSAMLPELIGMLTPNGQLPTSIPSGVSSYLGGLGNLGQAGGKVSHAVGSTVRNAEAAVPANGPPAASAGSNVWCWRRSSLRSVIAR
jgi:uncharacterized protein YidB (DUF937 family)